MGGDSRPSAAATPNAFFGLSLPEVARGKSRGAAEEGDNEVAAARTLEEGQAPLISVSWEGWAADELAPGARWLLGTSGARWPPGRAWRRGQRDARVGWISAQAS
jgi:hypothetical protein